jgi:hypothetical protein
VLRASVQEVLQAYLEAVRRNDQQQIPFWRAVLLERMVMVDDAVKHYQRASGTNSD